MSNVQPVRSNTQTISCAGQLQAGRWLMLACWLLLPGVVLAQPGRVNAGYPIRTYTAPTNSPPTGMTQPAPAAGLLNYGPTPIFGSAPAYGTAPVYGQQPAYGQAPAYPQSPLYSSGQPYAQPQYSQPYAQPAYSQPVTGQPQYLPAQVPAQSSGYPQAPYAATGAYPPTNYSQPAAVQPNYAQPAPAYAPQPNYAQPPANYQPVQYTPSSTTAQPLSPAPASVAPQPVSSGTTETTTAAAPAKTSIWKVWTKSIEGRELEYAQFGGGREPILIVGPLAGDQPAALGLVDKLAEYLQQNPQRLPDVRITVLRDPNPDGRVRRTRSNARLVDLNRNFPTANWRKIPLRTSWVSGRYAESEPETRAVTTLIQQMQPKRLIVLDGDPAHGAVHGSGAANAWAAVVSRHSGLALGGTDLTAISGSLPAYAVGSYELPTLTIAVPQQLTGLESWNRYGPALLAALDPPPASDAAAPLGAASSLDLPREGDVPEETASSSSFAPSGAEPTPAEAEPVFQPNDATPLADADAQPAGTSLYAPLVPVRIPGAGGSVANEPNLAPTPISESAPAADVSAEIPVNKVKKPAPIISIPQKSPGSTVTKPTATKPDSPLTPPAASAKSPLFSSGRPVETKPVSPMATPRWPSGYVRPQEPIPLVEPEDAAAASQK